MSADKERIEQLFAELSTLVAQEKGTMLLAVRIPKEEGTGLILGMCGPTSGLIELSLGIPMQVMRKLQDAEQERDDSVDAATYATNVIARMMDASPPA